MLAAYRRIYGEAGIRECLPFDGIDPLLRDLAGDGVTLAVATSKAQVYAEKIVEYRGGRSCSRRSAATRSTPLGRRRRTSSARCCAASAAPTDAIMVGDRLHDVEGARTHGLDCLGVGWGYAAPGELEEAGAVAVCPDPAALARALRETASGTVVA